MLAPHFDAVIATDASKQQIAAATRADNVQYRVVPAERSGIDEHSVDLITVAQALHWFDIDAFFAEAARVMVKRGVLAVWSYERCTVDADCDQVIDEIFAVVEDYWPAERAIVDGGYRGVVLPFEPIALTPVSMRMDWTADEALGYFRTWSAARRYHAQCGVDPYTELEEPLREAWGSGRRCMHWPLTVLAGRA